MDQRPVKNTWSTLRVGRSDWTKGHARVPCIVTGWQARECIGWRSYPLSFTYDTMHATPKFDFYEKVLVQSSDPAKAHLHGEVGVILGRTETDDQKCFLYAVLIDSSGRTWSQFEYELESIARRAKRDECYDGSSVRIRVDHRGRGTVAPSEGQE